MVKDVIGAAPSNHGTNSALAICSIECPAAFWQQRTGSDFITALNSRREAMPRIGYTNIYTHYDLIVVPNRDDTGRSSLQGPGRITNVAAQDICPLNVSDHLAIGTVDPLAWALFLDAVRHRGPANPARIKPTACSQAFMPGVDPRTVATDLAAAATALATTSALYPRVRAEPKLRNYVFKR